MLPHSSDVSRVCLCLFRRVLLCRHPVCEHLLHSQQCAHSDRKLYNCLILLLVLHPSHWPHSWTHSLLGNDPTFYLMDCISDFSFLLSLRKSRPNAFSRLTIICVLYLQLFHLLSHIYLLKNLIPSTLSLPGFATSFANQMFISFTQ